MLKTSAQLRHGTESLVFWVFMTTNFQDHMAFLDTHNS